MAIDEIKSRLHFNIDTIKDEIHLQMLNDAAEAYATKQPDIIDLLTPEQQRRLEESLKQADEGKFTSHEEVMKLSKQWLIK